MSWGLWVYLEQRLPLQSSAGSAERGAVGAAERAERTAGAARHRLFNFKHCSLGRAALVPVRPEEQTRLPGRRLVLWDGRTEASCLLFPL